MPSHLRILARRKELKLSQVQLARLVKPFLPGIDDSDISKIETGRRKLLADEIPAFATALKCRVDELMDEKPD